MLVHILLKGLSISKSSICCCSKVDLCRSVMQLVGALMTRFTKCGRTMWASINSILSYGSHFVCQKTFNLGNLLGGVMGYVAINELQHVVRWGFHILLNSDVFHKSSPS
ncbi:hypothetical protein Nepgr_013119 [Nepenthes gracilis]|uniref:Uncharacterized protein n=1 Tax=Nepenthes gracilis TaxID=150966 RepID=A0AAD3XNP8_NEPGR|nr:hypothetical protein Nepgr_013119 [Nepenthes gracilis]